MHLGTFEPSAVGAMLAHYERGIGRRSHIDEGMPIKNYAEIDEPQRERYNRLVDGLDFNCKTRPLADLLITKPKGLECDTDEFFKAVYEVVKGLVGYERVVSAFVHLDEPGAEPHMHFAFVPVVETPVMTNDKSKPLLWTKADERKNPEHRAGTQRRDAKGTLRWERVPALDDAGHPIIRRTASCSKLFSRTRMKGLHGEVERALCAKLGFDRVGMVLDGDDPTKKWSRLEHEDFVAVTRARADAADELECLQRRGQERQEVLAQRQAELGQVQGLLRAARVREQAAREANQGLKAVVSHLKAVLARAMREVAGFAERIGLGGCVGLAWTERFGFRHEDQVVEDGLAALEASARCAAEAVEGLGAERGQSPWQR